MDSLDALDNALDNLEEVLAPLLAKSLPETLDELELLQKAKLQVLLPYVVNDLVFIYLKTRGINPKTHPVVGELDRVKEYFQKIKNAEDPEKRRFAVDQGAATRFIKHAIKESQALQEQALQEQAQRELKKGTHTRFTDTSAEAGPSQSKVAVPRATEAALAKIKARETALQQEDSESEESELEVFAEPALPNSVEDRLETGKGKSKVVETSQGSKRGRGMDPWTGYDENSSGVSTTQDQPIDKQRRKRTKKESRLSTIVDGATSHLEGINPTMGQMVTKPAVTQNTTPVGKPKSTKNDPPEVIDVDTPSPKISDTQDPPKSIPHQVIDVDAMDSSQSSTPLPAKARKRKKKKKLNS